VVHVIVAPCDVVLAETDVITGGGSVLFTVTEMLATAVFPAASLATAASVCNPFPAVLVFQETL
jgi:hypothetical protein